MKISQSVILFFLLLIILPYSSAFSDIIRAIVMTPAQIKAENRAGAISTWYSSSSSVTSSTTMDRDDFIKSQGGAFLIKEYDTISEEVARGAGSHVDALADIMGCSKDSHSQFTKILRSHYQDIFYPRQQIIPDEFFNDVERLIRKNESIKDQCTFAYKSS